MKRQAKETRGWRILSLLLALGVLAPSGAVAATLIFDEFDGPGLNPAWQVQSGTGSYTVSGGLLRYNNGGPVAATTGWTNPALTLVLPFIGTQWQVDTKATSHLVYQISGASSGSQSVQQLVSFKPYDQLDPAKDAALIARGTDEWYSYNRISGSYGSNFGEVPLSPPISLGCCGSGNQTVTDTFWYRFVRNGSTITSSYSADGLSYTVLSSATLANPSNSQSQFVLGGMTFLQAGSYTEFDYVRITSTETPEPSTWLLFGIGLALLPLRRIGHRTPAGRPRRLP